MIAQLIEYHCMKLAPASEVLYLAITIILVYGVVELSSILKCSKLSENVFGLNIVATFWGCSVIKSKPFYCKILHKRLLFNYFKD